MYKVWEDINNNLQVTSIYRSNNHDSAIANAKDIAL